MHTHVRVQSFTCKGGGGRFVCSVYMYMYDICEWSLYPAVVYMYMYDICEWSLYPAVAREETNIGMGSNHMYMYMCSTCTCMCSVNLR